MSPVKDDKIVQISPETAHAVQLEDEDDRVLVPYDGAVLKDQPERFINRELSWLSFNQRVLEEANNPGHPLFERLRFLSIAASNLEEFFMVRVAGIRAQVKANVTSRSSDGLSPQQQLDMIREQVMELTQNMEDTWGELRELLEQQQVKVLEAGGLNRKQCQWLKTKFEEDIFPMLTPIVVDPAHPFPFIPNAGMTIALQLYETKRKQEIEALIVLPQQLERFIRIPGDTPQYIQLERLIMMHIDQIFPHPMEVVDHALFRVIRDSEIEIEEESEDLVLTFETALKQRRRGNVILLSVNRSASEDILDFLVGHFNLQESEIIRTKGLVGLSDSAQLITDEDQNLLFTPFDARFPERIRDFGSDCFAAISHKDIVVHHPYESFNVVEQFLRQAARDPDVVSIKQTLYRTGDQSTIAAALIEAAEHGKSVTAMVELKARFDEEPNIRWARNLERAGVQVVYGFVDLKTHAKVSYVLRREGQKLKAYAHFGTGNYHPETARIYTDLSYFTCDKGLCHDAMLLFNFMTGYAKPVDMKSLRIAPLFLRQTLTDLIDNEIRLAQEGKPAMIWAKCNSLLDPDIIDKFYDASCAGVQIELVVRGICSLRPGIPGLSENIHVKSMVGRFLEHSRIYCFGNGANLPSRKAKVFISSADLMQRNLDRRIEVLVPINNKTVHKQVLDQIMIANLKDQKQSWTMLPDGRYKRKQGDENAFCAHDYFMNNPSLSGRGKALKAMPMPPPLQLPIAYEDQEKSMDESKK